jgi:hypothetical protein
MVVTVHARRGFGENEKLRIAQAREVPNYFLDELLSWLMQHRV